MEGIHTICRWDDSILLVIVHSCRSSLLMALGARVRMLLMQTYLTLEGERVVPKVMKVWRSYSSKFGVKFYAPYAV